MNILVLGDAEVQGDDVKLALILRKIGGDLLAHDGLGQMGNRQRTIQGIVVGNGDPIHSPLAGDLVEAHRIGKTLRTADFL